MNKYVLGLDFGTNSCRALIVDVSNGNELASSIFQYPSGEAGIIVDSSNPHLARQNPADYIIGIEFTIKNAIKAAKKIDSKFDALNIIGIGVDTTGSSPLPVNSEGTPLCFLDEFKNNPNAMVWLWKDHTSFKESEKITELASEIRPQYMSKIGGTYSSEWFWSKILHCKNIDEKVFNAAYSFVEICDWITASLIGDLKPENIKRSVCAAGHKAMYNSIWGGLPDEEFLNKLSPGLGELKSRLYNKAYPASHAAGNISKEWAEKLGLNKNVIVSVGSFDAHMGAVGAGVQTGTLVKIIGTSTCDVMVWPSDKSLNDIKGVCGIVDGSVMDGYYGIEAGQSGVGDIFLWFVNNLVPEKYGKTVDEKFKTLGEEASKLQPGETGLLALDWNNGNRTILVDTRLTGLLLGQTLHTKPHEIYRALIEATAFGALTIINRIEEYGVPVKEVVNCGGLASKNSLLMQIYADITGRPMKISRSDQTPALGAAIFGAIAAGKKAGGYDSVEEAKQNMIGIKTVYNPIEANHKVYIQIYNLYKKMHDAFGTTNWNGNLFDVMKELLVIKDSIKTVK